MNGISTRQIPDSPPAPPRQGASELISHWLVFVYAFSTLIYFLLELPLFSPLPLPTPKKTTEMPP